MNKSSGSHSVFLHEALSSSPQAAQDIYSYTESNIMLLLYCLSFIPGGGELKETHLEGVTDTLRKKDRESA